jgi:hypothetical protein
VLEDDPAVPGAPQNDIIENNIFEDATGSVGIDIAGSGHTYRYNIITDPPGVGGGMMALCTPGCLTSHPVFVNAAGGADMRLAANSPGVDAGISSIVAVDLRGLARPVDMSVIDSGAGASTFVDIGAYERQAGDP